MRSSYKARWGNDRKRKATHPRRAARQQRAAERKAEWDELTPNQRYYRTLENRAAYQQATNKSLNRAGWVCLPALTHPAKRENYIPL